MSVIGLVLAVAYLFASRRRILRALLEQQARLDTRQRTLAQSIRERDRLAAIFQRERMTSAAAARQRAAVAASKRAAAARKHASAARERARIARANLERLADHEQPAGRHLRAVPD